MELPKRKLHRLKSWDYSQNGYYHITICTKNKKKLLSHIQQQGDDVTVEPTALGKIVLAHWLLSEKIYPYIKMDYCCLMPNHLHGIVIIDCPEDRQAASLNEVIRAFKSVTTRYYNSLVCPEGKNTLWQSSYYDEIIRDEQMLYSVRKYIQGNPSKWLSDDLYVK